MKKQINITISNKVFCLLIIISVGVIASVSISVLAEDIPEVMGHSLGEIASPEDCYNGQILRFYNGELICDYDDSLASGLVDVVQLNVSEICFEEGCSEGWPYDYVVDIPLVYSDHTDINCTEMGGEIYKDDIYSFCRFDGATCPTGWNQFLDWSTTIPIDDCREHLPFPFDPSFQPCNTKFHDFSNTRQEYCNCLYPGDDQYERYFAPIKEIGCY
ncbi:hypothetical protein KAS08_05225 [Candidatus Pacearchaeota archaeon]|nr:hypothetical protein [Candidatus Pacearchaeota archaeon]